MTGGQTPFFGLFPSSLARYPDGMHRSGTSLGFRLRSVSLRFEREAASDRWPRPSSRAGGRLLRGSTRNDDEVAAGPFARSPAMARLEAVLFLSREPLATRKLAQLANLADGTKARTLLRQLSKLYDARGSAFQVEEVAGGFQLFTRQRFAAWLRRLEEAPQETRLSGPALETLSVVAYRQPVLRADVEAIRGVQCGEILRQLMERDLVRIAGRAEELGRPFLYGTTKRFLQLFGLRHIEDLPRAEELRLVETDFSETLATDASESNDNQSPETAENEKDTQEEDEVTIADPSQDEEQPLKGAAPSEVTDSIDEDDLYEDEEYEFDDEDEEEYGEESDDESDEEELEGDWEVVEDDDEEEYEGDDEVWEDDEEEEGEDWEDDEEEEEDD